MEDDEDDLTELITFYVDTVSCQFSYSCNDGIWQKNEGGAEMREILSNLLKTVAASLENNNQNIGVKIGDKIITSSKITKQ